MQILRSWLFVPGNQSKMIKKASTLDVDVLIYDLEDSVPLGEKETARQLVAAALQPARGRSLRYVRVPADDSGLGDYLRAVVRPGLDGLVVPKVQSPVDVQRLDASLAERELATGREVGSIRLLATIESARGLLAAPAVAGACSRLMGLFFGAEDFALDLGIPDVGEGSTDQMLYARSAIAIAAASCQLAAIDRVVTEFRSTRRLAVDARRARQLGFRGKAVIHPCQIECVHDVFSPSVDEVEKARQVINAFETAVRDGMGSTQVDGTMVDLPVVQKARRIVALDGALNRSPTPR